MNPTGLNPISIENSRFLPVHSSIVSPCSLFLTSLLRRDSTPQEFAIQVGTPKRGSTQRIKTMYAARKAINANQSGIRRLSGSEWARIAWCLLMKNFRLDFDRALDRVGNKAILFGFLQDTRHSREIVGRGNHDPRFHYDLG